MRYYFHVRERGELVPDLEGIEFSKFADVVEEAKQAARDVLACRLVHDQELDGQAFEVTDETGEVVLVLPFVDVIR